ncbi:MAG: glycoside hydrolase family 5 protein [Bacteroidetes bacterium]|nr:glycoside hydrolase family 5 protein [Bacteroidota bacterium]
MKKPANLVKRLISSFLTILIITTFGISQSNIQNPSGFKIKKGVNLSHWLSQNFGWSPKATFITEKDIKFIDSIGYDHVRLPIDEQELWDDNGYHIEESFNYLTQCLDWCAKYDLRAIVDLHIIRSHHFNAANEGGANTLWTDTIAQNIFLKLWIELSNRLKKYPVNMVAYELMNEPVADNPDDWNKLIEKAVKTIRSLEPNRVIVIGSNKWQIPQTFPDLKVPENDKNIILSTHTYSPLHFTHYTASWVPAKMYTGPVHYPGQVVTDADYDKYVDTTDSVFVKAMEGSKEVYNKQKLAEELMPAIKKAKELDLQLYCGEFGCLPHVERADRLKYYSDIVSIFRENNIAYCNWEYKGDFGIYKFDFEKLISLSPDVELIHILTK